MNESDISCIIPVYNGEKYLAEAIDSVLAQTLPPREIIVIDDGSTDGSAAVAKGYGEKVRYTHQPNANSAAARNHGLRLARGAFIAFLDADDIYHADKLSLQMRCFMANPRLELSLCRALNFWSPEIDASRRKPETFEPDHTPGQVQTWLARRSLFERVGGFTNDPKFTLGEGSELFLRIQQDGAAIGRMDELLLYRRLHDTNKTCSREAHLDVILRLMKKKADCRRVTT